MALFGKKKEEERKECCCGGKEKTLCCDQTERCCEGKMTIRVLGSGCKNCHRLYENVKKAVADSGIEADVEYITDLEKVMEYGVMTMPAVVINEQVVSMGKVLSVREVMDLIL